MSEDDLIRRGTAEKLLRDLQDDLVKKGQHQDALTIGMAADLIAMGPDAVQPAPDVAALVEALRDMIVLAAMDEWNLEFPGRQATLANARAALAAMQGQGA